MSQGEMEKCLPRRRHLSITGEREIDWTSKVEEYTVMELSCISSQWYFIHVGTDLKQNLSLMKVGSIFFLINELIFLSLSPNQSFF